MADVRISGLDDSVSPEEVAAAIAKVSGCSTESIKVGEIREVFSGGATVVRVPVPVAKTLSQGRLLVGWVSAKVKVLPPKEMRCFRCWETGHTGAQCTAEVDRSNHCYRCNKPGHKSRDCKEAPNCPLCAAAKKPADHKVGSRVCSPPKSKSKGKAGKGRSSARTRATPTSPNTQGPMEVSQIPD
ncbi:hypothetical protein ABMA28_014026 [Loxostege sticticalis]